MEEQGLSGRLLMECPVCRRVRAFYPKRPLRTYECVCDQITRPENVIPVFVSCECGKGTKYLTNATALQFTLKCHNCGSPVEMELNKRRTAYVTMGAERKKRK